MSGANEDEALARRKAAALRRREEHDEWKREFFQARPPPPPIGRLHRRQQGKTKGSSCHTLFASALALHSQHAEPANINEEQPTDAVPSMSAAPLSSVGASDAVPLSKQEAWAAQLREEQARRNPATDLNIRSDPTRTVIMANLHPDTVDEDLRHFADQFGRVVNVRIVRHVKTGKSRRYAFVEFGLAGEARRALQSHRKKRLKGHAIIIDREKGRTEPRFLPKRMATAEAFLSSSQHGARDESALATLPETDGTGSVRNSGAVDGVSGDAVLPVAAKPTMPEDDDDFLNSILNS